MWISGTGVARDFLQATGRALTTREIVAEVDSGGSEASAAMERFADRLARGLASVINVLDPDVLVFGGGLSLYQRIYTELPQRLAQYVFGGEAETVLVQARYGDSSGVRGAAWLWPAH
jgi:fructokinase